MPVKRRRRRARGLKFDAAAADLWPDWFDHGQTLLPYLGEETVGLPRPGDATDEEVEDAVREAWERLGADYMAMAEHPGRGRWALKRFGEPPRA